MANDCGPTCECKGGDVRPQPELCTCGCGAGVSDAATHAAVDGTPPYTVVGVYNELFDHNDPTHIDGYSFVEWVEATDPTAAICEAREKDEAREAAVIIAVFEGHIVDKLFNKGLAS